MEKEYIAGKITGDPNYKEKFAKAAEIIAAEGNLPINPANNHEGLTPKAYMRISFDLIDDSDRVRFLPDYEDSPGAMLELRYCEYTGKPYSFFKRSGRDEK